MKYAADNSSIPVAASGYNITGELKSEGSRCLWPKNQLRHFIGDTRSSLSGETGGIEETRKVTRYSESGCMKRIGLMGGSSATSWVNAYSVMGFRQLLVQSYAVIGRETIILYVWWCVKDGDLRNKIKEREMSFYFLFFVVYLFKG